MGRKDYIVHVKQVVNRSAEEQKLAAEGSAADTIAVNFSQLETYIRDLIEASASNCRL